MMKKKHNFKTGDILLFKSKNPLSKLICFVTNSKYSHVGVYYGELGGRGFFAEALAWGVVLTPVDIVPVGKYDVFRVLDYYSLSREILQERIIKYLGVGYDYVGLLGIALEELKLVDKNLLQNPKLLFCSEFLSKVWYNLFGERPGILSPGDASKNKYFCLVFRGVDNENQ